jgi:hypothetical protein
MNTLILKAIILIVLYFGACGCGEGNATREKDNPEHKTLQESKSLENYFLVEKKEVMQRAEHIFLKLEDTKDSLLHLPANQRNLDSFRLLNVISNKQSSLIKSIMEARDAGPLEWDFHHQKLKNIFNEISKLLSSDKKENKGE